MSLAESLTPSNTEEIKPELFVQKWGDKYRVVNPMAWNGKVRWKEQIKTIFSLRTLISLGIVLFIVYAYLHDNQGLLEFHEKIAKDPAGFCRDFDELRTKGICNDFLQQNGICDLPGYTYPSEEKIRGVLNVTVIRSS